MGNIISYWLPLLLLLGFLALFLQVLEVDKKRVELAATLNQQLNIYLIRLSEESQLRDEILRELKARIRKLEGNSSNA